MGGDIMTDYTVRPPDITPGLQMLAQGLQQGSQKRGAREAQAKFESLRVGAAEAFNSEDPEKIASFIVANPEWKDAMDAGIDVREQEKRRLYSNTAKEILLTDKPDFQALTDLAEYMLSRGDDASEVLESIDEYSINPESAKKRAELILATYDQDAYKAYMENKETDVSTQIETNKALIAAAKTTREKNSAIQKQANTLRSSIEKAGKDFNLVDASYNKLKRAAKLGTAAGDMAMIFGYMKMLDPGSAVKEGEYASVENAAGVPDRLMNFYNKSIDGQKLQETQRQEFLSASDDIYSGQRETYDRQIGETLQLADEDSVSRDKVLGARRLKQWKERQPDTQADTDAVFPSSEQPAQPQTTDPEGTTGMVNGVKWTVRNGAWGPA